MKNSSFKRSSAPKETNQDIEAIPMYRDDARQDDEKNYLELLESFNNNQNSNRNTKEKPNVYENTE